MREMALKVERIVFLIIGVGMTLIMFINALGRYVFKSTFLWAEEGIRILFVWGMFIAITELFLKDGHIGFDVIKKANKKINRISDLITNIVLLALGLNLVWFGMKIVGTIGKVPLAATKFPNAIFFYPGIIAGAIWSIIGLYNIYKGFKNHTTEVEK